MSPLFGCVFLVMLLVPMEALNKVNRLKEFLEESIESSQTQELEVGYSGRGGGRGTRTPTTAPPKKTTTAPPKKSTTAPPKKSTTAPPTTTTAPTPGYQVSISGVGTDDPTIRFIGQFIAESAQVENDQLFIVGHLLGSLVRAVTGTNLVSTDQGEVGQVVDEIVSLLVSQVTASCKVLHLHLDSLEVNLLGTQITLDSVNLDITANPSQGLLGAILCLLGELLGNLTVVVSDLLSVTLNTLAELINKFLFEISTLCGSKTPLFWKFLEAHSLQQLRLFSGHQ
jgi:hypothetical protein